MDSEFLKWFENQFGPEPVPTEAEARELRQRIDDGLLAKDRLNADSEYHRRRTAALYAWQAARKNEVS